MRVRRPTLQEWFLDYQLAHNDRAFSHFPVHLDVDISAQARRLEAAGEPLSPTALVVQAASTLLRERPALNRVPFRTPLGSRILELDTPRVNLPVLLDVQGQPYVSATVVHEGDRKTVAAIHEEIQAFKRTDPKSLPLGRVLVPNRNTWLNRAKLRTLHHLVHAHPRVYARYAGAISVSVTAKGRGSDRQLRCIPFGPTILTLGLSGVDTPEAGVTRLRLGVGFNHSFMAGHEFIDAMHRLSDILTGKLGRTVRGLTPEPPAPEVRALGAAR